MANIGFSTTFPGSYAVLQPYRISGHAPTVLKIQKVSYEKPNVAFVSLRCFGSESNYCILLIDDRFVGLNGLRLVKGLDGIKVKAGPAGAYGSMGFNCEWHDMFKLFKRLRSMKKPLRKLLHAQYIAPAHTSVQTSVWYIALAYAARTNKEYKQGLRK
ncbi:hypothetical protein Tco_1075632 [Tanacetum coccineum]